MSLPTSQQRALDQIEKTLADDHPGLGPLFNTFTRLAGQAPLPLFGPAESFLQDVGHPVESRSDGQDRLNLRGGQVLSGAAMFGERPADEAMASSSCWLAVRMAETVRRAGGPGQGRAMAAPGSPAAVDSRGSDLTG